jgi:hypothetical protein
MGEARLLDCPRLFANESPRGGTACVEEPILGGADGVSAKLIQTPARELIAPSREHEHEACLLDGVVDQARFDAPPLEGGSNTVEHFRRSGI